MATWLAFPTISASSTAAKASRTAARHYRKHEEVSDRQEENSWREGHLHTFTEPPTALFVRLEPTAWNRENHRSDSVKMLFSEEEVRILTVKS